MITHELAKVKNESTHIADFFHPNPVYSVFGRSANMTPKCNPGYCLYYTWKASFWKDQSRRDVHHFGQEVLGSTHKRVVERTSVCPQIGEIVFCFLDLRFPGCFVFCCETSCPIRALTRDHIPPRPGEIQHAGCHLPDDLVTPLPGRCSFFYI